MQSPPLWTRVATTEHGNTLDVCYAGGPKSCCRARHVVACHARCHLCETRGVCLCPITKLPQHCCPCIAMLLCGNHDAFLMPCMSCMSCFSSACSRSPRGRFQGIGSGCCNVQTVGLSSNSGSSRVPCRKSGCSAYLGPASAWSFRGQVFRREVECLKCSGTHRTHCYCCQPAAVSKYYSWHLRQCIGSGAIADLTGSQLFPTDRLFSACLLRPWYTTAHLSYTTAARTSHHRHAIPGLAAQ